MQKNNPLPVQNRNSSQKCMCFENTQQKVSYFCLQDYCINQRVFCQKCAKSNHVKHNIGRIDQFIPPLNLLNINSQYVNSKQIYQNLSKKLGSLINQIKNLQQMVTKYAKNIETFFLKQLKCLVQTFEQNKLTSAKQILLGQNVDKFKLNQVIYQIKFLQCHKIEDCLQIQKICTNMMDKIQVQLQNYKNQLDCLMQKMWNQLKSIQFGHYYEKYTKDLQQDAMRIFQFCELK